MNILHNISDCVVNISYAEGFGLSTLESLACGTPIIVNMTGGLQEQVTDGEQWFGIGIKPTASAIIGSQKIPYIYEDRISKADFLDAMRTMFNQSEEERIQMTQAGIAHVNKTYSFDGYTARWVELLEDIHARHGSWETRKGYERWSLSEVA